MLRKHQIDMIRIVDGIIGGSGIRNIIVKATPGSGKSSIPIIAGKLITAGLADALAWVCPRMSLQDQGERNFIDPFFRKMFNHNLAVRQSTNDVSPLRGTNGLITTFQAVGVDVNGTLLNEFRHRRYILITDETHHASEGGIWTKAIIPLYERAAFRVLMTGTASRHDGKRIAFTPYDDQGDGTFTLNLAGDKETAVIEYTRVDALRERAILPVSFFFNEGTAKWQKLTGKVVEAKLSTAKDPSHALYTALHTEYAEELLHASVDHWAKHRLTTNPGATLLVVCAKIEDAKKMTGKLKEWGRRAKIATSDDTPQALRHIKEFRAGKLDILITVGMAYEGGDYPSVSHIACLTNIRSYEWISQMVARAVRIDPAGGPYESQRAYIFAPNDLMFREIAAKIEADQTDPAIEHKGNGKQALEADGGFELEGADMRAPGGITPLSSRLTGYNEMSLFGSMAMDPEIKTNREQESDLLSAIEAHIRRYSFQNRHNPKCLNAEIYSHFGGKARRQMTIRELEEVLAYVRERYPASYVRGTGRPRVSTKAVQVAVQWR